MHRGGPYWLPPRRAPFGRSAGQPSKGAPTGTARSPRARKRAVSPFPAAGKRSTPQGLDKNPNTESCDLFHLRGHTAMAHFGNEAADRGGGGGRWGLRANGDKPLGWYACPWRTLFATEWSAARQNPLRAAVVPFSALILQTSRRAGFCRAAAENFRPEIFEARATLRSQRESAVGRRPANLTRPRLPANPTARLRHRDAAGPSPFARNRGLPPFLPPAW